MRKHTGTLGNLFARRDDGFSLGSLVDVLIAFLLALGPILQHYRGLLVNAGISVLILLLPFVLGRQISKLREIDYRGILAIIPLAVFVVYKLIDHGFTFEEFAHGMIVIFYFAVAASGCIDTDRFISATTWIASFASILIIVQYVCFYIFDFHLQLVPTGWLLPKSAQWIPRSEIGMVGMDGKPSTFYRPSSFFLEPAHMFLYLFPPLIISLSSFSVNRIAKMTAILLSLALILSTSGMGIATVVGVWGIYFLRKAVEMHRLGKRRFFSLKNVVITVSVLLGLTLICFYVPFIRKSINRIFSAGGTSSNAISGRISRGLRLTKQLTGTKFWFGVSDNVEGINFHLSGFNATMYRYGLIGVILSYVFYFRSLLVLKDSYFWISAVIVVISFFSAHTHGTFYMQYFVYFLLSGYKFRTPRTRRICFKKRQKIANEQGEE